MAAMAMPGDAIHAFWLALTTRSTPQASISKRMAPRPLMPSTMTSGSPGAAWMAATSSRSGLATPVEVSLCVSSTARYGGASARRAASAAGSAASPHSTSKRSTCAPKACAMSANRSPKPPMMTASTRSPGERLLTMAASIAPEPEPVMSTMSPWVPINVASPLVISACISANSLPR